MSFVIAFCLAVCLYFLMESGNCFKNACSRGLSKKARLRRVVYGVGHFLFAAAYGASVFLTVVLPHYG